jgi:hypothetical protein
MFGSMFLLGGYFYCGRVHLAAFDVLGTSAVPSPIVGAGLPGRIAAGAGLLAMARRKRTIAAAA